LQARNKLAVAIVCKMAPPCYNGKKHNQLKHILSSFHLWHVEKSWTSLRKEKEEKMFFIIGTISISKII
jgi:hypothetical protein